MGVPLDTMLSPYQFLKEHKMRCPALSSSQVGREVSFQYRTTLKALYSGCKSNAVNL